MIIRGIFILLSTNMDKQLLRKKIKDMFIVREYDGSYVLFGKYVVIPINDMFEISIDGENTNYMFSSLKNAVTWCVFEKNNKYKEFKRLYELDQLASSLEVHIQQYEKLAKKNNGMQRDIFLARLIEEKAKRKHVLSEIQEYIQVSRYLQSKKFAENQEKIDK